MNFNFGTPKPTAAPTAAATPTLNFGAGDNKGLQLPAKTPTFGSFGTPTTTATATPTLNFGATPAPTINFGTPSTAASAFSLNTPTSTVAASKPLTSFTLTTPTATAAVSTPATTATGFTLGTPASSTGFTLGSTTTSTTPGLSFGALSSTGLNLGTTTTTTTAPTTFNLPKTTSVSTTLLSTSTTTPSLGTAPATVTTPGNINFNQLEEVLNKWTLELEEQGKVFINQALQLNAWDRLIIANGEKILSLNNGIEKVKQQQQQLDRELEFVLIQQRELEECIAPLEKELKDIPIADHDRNHTYQMAENMDTQLKQMSEDLKEIIEHLNESNKSEDQNDPVIQIGRILNAHMNSLQWIDRSTAQISTHLDQITKMHDMHRRDNERSFHLTYE